MGGASNNDEWISNSQVEATAGEALDRSRLLFDGAALSRVESLLSFALDLLAALLLVVLALHVLKLTS